MITYIKAKNFKSLKQINFDLNKTKEKTNQFIAIYGENGSGKTNIVELFSLLQQLTMAKVVNINMNKMLRGKYGGKEQGNWKTAGSRKFLIEAMLSLEDYRNVKLEDYRMIDEKEATELEYGFKINDIDGFYYIKFTDEIIEEKLYYMADKQRGYLFRINKDESEILSELNKKIFLNGKYNQELIDNINKYWGKYSFLSLLLFERMEKNKEYTDNNISKSIFNIINNVLSMIVHLDSRNTSIMEMPDNIIKQRKLENIQYGRIDKKDLSELRKYENILNIFFTQGYADIKNVEYVIEESGEEIYYELHFYKMIGGELREIDYYRESDGTQRILKQFNTLMGALMGETVIIDEIDNGIHDVLMKNIIMSIKDEITGQLIITTHNTLLLEVLPKECIYILTTDYNGNKNIGAIKEYGIKIQKNNNARDLYFKGVFGGIPNADYIDFEEIKYALASTEADGDENVNEQKT